MYEQFQGHSPRIDPTAFIHATATLIGRISLGAESSVWPHVTLRGDDGSITIGSQTSIQDNAVVHMTEGVSNVEIGSRVTVGHGAILHGCSIADECIIGMGAIVLDNAVVEPGCIIGAGSLVPPGKRVPAGSVCIGNPLQVLRSCTAKDRDFITLSWKEYVERTRQYRAENPS